MAIEINIDTTNKPDSYIEMPFDDKQFILRLRYNPRSGWKLSLYDPTLFKRDILTDNTTAKVYGEVAVMPLQDSFKFISNTSLPQGQLILLDNEARKPSDFKYPEENEIGVNKRFSLYYFPVGEEIEEVL